MVIERAAKEAVYVVAGIDADQHRSGLKKAVAAYLELRDANDTNPFFAAALDPSRGVSAAAARELLVSLRADWDRMQTEFNTLSAGDEKNFDLSQLLAAQTELVGKVERLAAALVRYASVTYGS
jgi:alkanesulfonate monooxygenase SsuD/methylene tetrahydromethanopterin reductase-like flavin-dependent oxidoreductase (luciferase family)